jgi:hypothetical protein
VRARVVGIVLLAVAALLPAGGASAEPTLLVADLSALTADEQMVFAALEGIVNRDVPILYLLGFRDGHDYVIDETAELWLRDAVPLATERVAPYDALDRLKDRVRGLVVWDPGLKVDTQNVATTIAGQQDLLPVSPDLIGLAGLPVVHDLRDLHLHSREQAYQWALDNLGPPSRFGHLAWLGDPRNGRPYQHGFRDWVVSRRGFAFDGDPKLEAGLVRRILDAFPQGTTVFGYPFFDDAQYQRSSQVATGEPAGVTEISLSGKVLVPSLDLTNFSVHSSFPTQTQAPQWDDTPLVPDITKTYVAFLITDGDNLGHNEHYLRQKHWDDPLRGSIPMGVSISPFLALYAPKLYGWYVRTMTPNDVLVMGPSGAGYTYPSLLPNLDAYLERTHELMDLSGLRAPWILDFGYAASPSPLLVQRYIDALHPSAVFADYGGYVLPNPPAVTYQDGVPVVHALWSQDVGATANQIKVAARTSGTLPGFVLVALSTSRMGFRSAASVMSLLGADYVAVRPDHFAGLIRGSHAVP